jgi:hypothetical protein
VVLQAVVGLIQFFIALLMLAGYRKAGIWGCATLCDLWLAQNAVQHPEPEWQEDGADEEEQGLVGESGLEVTGVGGVGLIVANGIGVEKAEVEGDETSTKAGDDPKHVLQACHLVISHAFLRSIMCPQS